MEPGKYQIVKQLRDGSVITIRAIHPGDRERFVNAFQLFIKSPDSARSRFHGLKRSISDKEANNMTDIDFAEHVALVATCGPEQDLIGVCRYMLCDDDRKHVRGEIAFAVLDEYQGKGIGSLLLQHLAIIGRSQGVQEFLADVLADNHRMIAVFERSGFPIKRSTEYGVERVLLTISPESPTENKPSKL